MAASARIFSFPTFHSHLKKTTPFHFPCRNRQFLPSPHRFSGLALRSHNLLFPKFPITPSVGPFRGPAPAKFSAFDNCFDRLFFGAKDHSYHWNFAPQRISNDRDCGIFYDGEGPEVAVVVLGWLGAKPRHLRRYVELYNNRGIHAVTFVASVTDVLWVDFGKRLEERVNKLAQELSEWLSNEDGRERLLMFHTFSNTGWMAYGAILDNLKDRPGLVHKIKGCIVDSGGDPNLDPKVWAAGFTTAVLKKNSSATYPSTEASIETQSENKPNGPNMEAKETSLIENILLSSFEKFFSYILNLPFVKQRLAKSIACLWNQPPCPQLYLYSTGDKVIPFQSIESFIEEQRRAGREVFSFNFGPSPHVDHFRTFPEVYVSQLDSFLKKCLSFARKL